MNFLNKKFKIPLAALGGRRGLSDYPKGCRILLRRLQQAVSEQNVRQIMIVEDEIVTEFEERDRREQRLAELAEEEWKQKEEAQAREAEARRREQDERRLKEEACQRE